LDSPYAGAGVSACSGHVDEGIDHLAMAILMCNKPDQVMSVFRQTLAEGHYALLERAVPKARRVGMGLWDGDGWQCPTTVCDFQKFAQLMAHSRHQEDEEGEQAAGDEPGGSRYEED